MTRAALVFLLDVDNTLLDNDRVTHDLRRFLQRELGEASADAYFSIFEELRRELGYADYLGALQRYRVVHPHDTRVLRASSFLIDYPFADRVYPGALEVIERMKAAGRPVILTDGDAVFQQRKIERSGVMDAVEGQVLIYIHKERELADVARRYPAGHYVLVDDKLRILTAVKEAWGSRVTTVFPRQGHYAVDREITAAYPPADVTVDEIGQLLDVDVGALGR
jgi:FMN phosphatase YigB (HAD superfamily)